MIKLILCIVCTVSSVRIAYAYNIDTDFPIIYSHAKTRKSSDASCEGGSYFGYTVAFFTLGERNTSWVIVGAPRGNYSRSGIHPIEPGVVYRCRISIDDADTDAASPDKCTDSTVFRFVDGPVEGSFQSSSCSCKEMGMSNYENEEGFIKQVGRKMRIRKDHGWFGSAMLILRLPGLIVCAPRTIVHILNQFGKTDVETMHGTCYFSWAFNDFSPWDRFDFYDFNRPFWYDPLHGFSIAGTPGSSHTTFKSLDIMIGRPAHEVYGTVSIIKADRGVIPGRVELPKADELSHFGYSATSGQFFGRDSFLFASGAPGWQYVGRVGIIDPAENRSSVIATIHGTQIGEYFGASLASGDVNNDGFDDLLIGAPHSGNDNGKVYLYYGSPTREFQPALSLTGSAEGGHFGYSLAAADLDADGFSDIIVGAPWEDAGVLYIYNGAADLEEGESMEPSQRISAIEMAAFQRSPPDRPIERFAFSLAEPYDIDSNGYKDIAVGAYKSGHALILRSKPVITSQLAINLIPPVLQRTANQFLIEVCPRYRAFSRHDTSPGADYKITLTLDRLHRRTKETHLELRSSIAATGVLCLIRNVTILDHVHDFIEPIAIVAEHEFIDQSSKVPREFCQHCPVERRGNRMNRLQEFLPFDIGCGDEKLCTAEILAVAIFHGVQDNDTWIIGSGDISIEIILENLGEPAYHTTLNFTLPPLIMLKSIPASCQENLSTDPAADPAADTYASVLTCSLGNPLGQREKKVLNISLDMTRLNNASLHRSRLNINLRIDTRSMNNGSSGIQKVLSLQGDFLLALNGKANSQTYFFPPVSNHQAWPRNISFEHVYQISKLGLTRIEQVRLVLKVPTGFVVASNERDASDASTTFVHLHQPQFTVAGQFQQCSLNPANRPALLSEADSHQEMQSLFDHSAIRNDIIYFNCSTGNVKCVKIVCDVRRSTTMLNIGTLSLQLILDPSLLLKPNAAVHPMGHNTILVLGTDAEVEIVSHDISLLNVLGTRSSANVVTVFYYDPVPPEKLQLWLLLLSLSVGLFLLLIVVFILRSLGFFNRNGKHKLTARRDNQEEPKPESSDQLLMSEIEILPAEQT